MRTICFVFFVLVSHYVESSVKDSKISDNVVRLMTFTDRNEVKSEQNILQISKNNASKNESCDCGKNGVCSFIDGKKTCKCFDGYSAYEGKCLKCDCGGKWKNCSFFKGVYLKRSCTCEHGYAVESCTGLFCNDTCTVCNCGGSFKNCSFGSYNNRKCICGDGYAMKQLATWSFHEACYECDCGSDGTCEFNYRKKKECNCRSGFEEVNGICQTCDCGNGKCSYGAFGSKRCDCDDGYAVYEGRCVPCDCGKGKCTYSAFGSKICDCDDDYASHDGKCVHCGCKEGEKCTITNNVGKCICKNGLERMNGKCQECDCGLQTVSCKLDDFQYNKCTCKDGYYAHRRYPLSNDECLDCNCGKNSIGCYSNWQNEKICKCKYGNVIRDIVTKCTDCNCGNGGKSCEFSSTGHRKCTCFSGYTLNFDYFNEDYCFKDETSYSGKSIGWKIATYVVSVIIVVIIIGMLIAIADKRGFRSRTT